MPVIKRYALQMEGVPRSTYERNFDDGVWFQDKCILAGSEIRANKHVSENVNVCFTDGAHSFLAPLARILRSVGTEGDLYDELLMI
jgi:hypothetical protein